MWLLLSMALGCGESGTPPLDAATQLDARTDAADDAALPDSSPSCEGEATHEGEATYYDADGTGNCSFDAPTSGVLLVAAMNDPDWQGSAVCGTCAAVTGPSGSVTVRIVDRCPECRSGDLDLSPDAFTQIAALELGRVSIRWREVPCDVEGDVIVHVKDGSSAYWAAYQLRNHRHRVVSLEVNEAGAWIALRRESYNYFVDDAMPGESARLRATDSHGSVIEADIAVVAETESNADGQFARCE